MFILPSIYFKHKPHLEDHLFRYLEKWHSNKTERKKNDMEILDTTFIVARTIYFLWISCWTIKKKRVGEIFNPSYFLVFYKIQERKTNPYLIFSTSKYQRGKILLRLIRGCRNSSVLECRLVTPMLVKTVHARATFVNQPVSVVKAKVSKYQDEHA